MKQQKFAATIRQQSQYCGVFYYVFAKGKKSQYTAIQESAVVVAVSVVITLIDETSCYKDNKTDMKKTNKNKNKN